MSRSTLPPDTMATARAPGPSRPCRPEAPPSPRRRRPRRRAWRASGEASSPPGSRPPSRSRSRRPPRARSPAAGRRRTAASSRRRGSRAARPSRACRRPAPEPARARPRAPRRRPAPAEAICLTAEATPPSSPPPPTGTTTSSTSGRSSTISSPVVPAPASTTASSNGCTNVRPARVAHFVQPVEQRRPVRMEDDLGAVAAHGLDLGRRGALGHDDDGRAAGDPRRPRHGRGVVSGGHGDEAAPALRVRQRQDLVQRSPRLEGAGLLQVLALQVKPRAGAPAELRRGEEWRAVHPAPDPARRGADLGERDHPRILDAGERRRTTSACS